MTAGGTVRRRAVTVAMAISSLLYLVGQECPAVTMLGFSRVPSRYTWWSDRALYTAARTWRPERHVHVTRLREQSQDFIEIQMLLYMYCMYPHKATIISSGSNWIFQATTSYFCWLQLLRLSGFAINDSKMGVLVLSES